MWIWPHPLLLQRRGKGVCGGEPGPGEQAGRVRREEGGRGRALARPHRASGAASSPGGGAGGKPSVREGLACGTSCDRRAESVLASGEVEESPDQSILRERSRGEPNFKMGSACPPLSVLRAPLGLTVAPFLFTCLNLAGCRSATSPRCSSFVTHRVQCNFLSREVIRLCSPTGTVQS